MARCYLIGGPFDGQTYIDDKDTLEITDSENVVHTYQVVSLVRGTRIMDYQGPKGGPWSRITITDHGIVKDTIWTYDPLAGTVLRRDNDKRIVVVSQVDDPIKQLVEFFLKRSGG